MRIFFATVALLAVTAQHPCGNPRVGGDSGVLLTTASFDNITWVPTTGYYFTSTDATESVGLIGGATPDTAPWGIYIKLSNISYADNTAIGSAVWWSTLTTSCTVVSQPVDYVSLSFRGVGPGFQFNSFAGTHTLDGRAVEMWSNAFQELIAVDTSTCTPVWLSATLVTDAAGQEVLQSMLVANVTATTPTPGFLRPASRCL